MDTCATEAPAKERIKGLAGREGKSGSSTGHTIGARCSKGSHGWAWGRVIAFSILTPGRPVKALSQWSTNALHFCTKSSVVQIRIGPEVDPTGAFEARAKGHQFNWTFFFDRWRLSLQA
jgi:hypothetical protein